MAILNFCRPFSLRRSVSEIWRFKIAQCIVNGKNLTVDLKEIYGCAYGDIIFDEKGSHKGNLSAFGEVASASANPVITHRNMLKSYWIEQQSHSSNPQH